jgi:hypothetical protein
MSELGSFGLRGVNLRGPGVKMLRVFDVDPQILEAGPTES